MSCNWLDTKVKIIGDLEESAQELRSPFSDLKKDGWRGRQEMKDKVTFINKIEEVKGTLHENDVYNSTIVKNSIETLEEVKKNLKEKFAGQDLKKTLSRLEDAVEKLKNCLKALPLCTTEANFF